MSPTGRNQVRRFPADVMYGITSAWVFSLGACLLASHLAIALVDDTSTQATSDVPNEATTPSAPLSQTPPSCPVCPRAAATSTAAPTEPSGPPTTDSRKMQPEWGVRAKEPAPRDPLILAARYDWTTDGRILVMATALSNVPKGQLNNLRLKTVASQGVQAVQSPQELAASFGQSLAPAEGTTLVDGALPVRFGAHANGAQLGGLYTVPKDRVSTIQLTLQAEGTEGPIERTQTLTMDPHAIRGRVLAISMPNSNEPVVFPPRSRIRWNDEEPAR